MQLDQHRNRIHVAAAMERAAALADSGDVAAGRGLLGETTEFLMMTPSHNSTMTSGLIQECQALQLEYSDRERYRSMGSKMSKMSAQSHYAQRSTHMSLEKTSYSAGKKSKGATKSAFLR